MKIRVCRMAVLLGCFALSMPLALSAQTPNGCLPGTKHVYGTAIAAADTAPGMSSIASAASTGSVQQYSVPGSVTALLITAVGASGGNAVTSDCSAKPNSTCLAGHGASVTAVVPVTGGSILDIFVGAEGGSANIGDDSAGGGGGGSFVFIDSSGTLLVASGGGGGAGYSQDGLDAQTTTAGGSAPPPDGGAGGTGGNGGKGGTNFNGGGGGGGYLQAGTDGADASNSHGDRISSPGDALGGFGVASPDDDGGFGGGGGGGFAGGGGGGGYSGGGGGGPGDYVDAGAGGGSFVASSATYSHASVLSTTGDGSVTICQPQYPVTAIPTLSVWALIALAFGLALAAMPMIARRS